MTDGREQERRTRTHRRAASKKPRDGIEMFQPHWRGLLTVKESGNLLQEELLFSRASCLAGSYDTGAHIIAHALLFTHDESTPIIN